MIHANLASERPVESCQNHEINHDRELAVYTKRESNEGSSGAHHACHDFDHGHRATEILRWL